MKQESKNRPTTDFQESLQHKSMRKGMYCQQMLLEQLNQHMEKKALGIYFDIIIRKLHYNSVHRIILTFLILMFPQSSSCFKDK